MTMPSIYEGAFDSDALSELFMLQGDATTLGGRASEFLSDIDFAIKLSGGSETNEGLVFLRESIKEILDICYKIHQECIKRRNLAHDNSD